MKEILLSTLGAGILFRYQWVTSPRSLAGTRHLRKMGHCIQIGMLLSVTPLLMDLTVFAVSLLTLKQLTNFKPFLSLISFIDALFLIFIGWLSLKMVGFNMKKKFMKPHSLITKMVRNYLKSPVKQFRFTIKVPFLLRSSQVVWLSAATFVVSFFSSIIISKMCLRYIMCHSICFLKGIWYPLFMHLLDVFLMTFALLFVKEGFTYFGVF